ncbi:MAG: hypothetical protein R6V50_07605 [Thermoplasmatota archaeon]
MTSLHIEQCPRCGGEYINGHDVDKCPICGHCVKCDNGPVVAYE